jgi:methionine synthase II (cobalamin-independent)
MGTMPTTLKPGGQAMLIGSQPLDNHDQATRLVFDNIPAIPNWVQLPVYPHEGMVDQFMAGLPGLVQANGRTYVDIGGDGFDEQLLAFFETYLQASEQGGPLGEDSPFALDSATAPGFYSLLRALQHPSEALMAVKGQITGPITFCTGLQDRERRAIFYHDTLRDAAVKMLALKAAWQADMLAGAGKPVIVFIDEPALAGFGSSEFISISKEDITACLKEVADAVQARGALSGVHVCANTDWSLLLESSVDIINFDAHGFFDKFVLYGDQIKSYLASGRYLAWGLVPTLRAEEILSATVDTLWRDWKEKTGRLADIGVPYDTIRAQSFVTPSCGTGSISPELSERVIRLTRALSDRIRSA